MEPAVVFRPREVNCVTESASERTAQQLELERDYVAQAYERLDELREINGQELAKVRRSDYGGGHQAKSERDAFASHYEDRLTQLKTIAFPAWYACSTDEMAMYQLEHLPVREVVSVTRERWDTVLTCVGLCNVSELE